MTRTFLLAALLLALATAVHAQSPAACSTELQRPRPAIAYTLAALAQHENTQMGGALINAAGGLVRAGFAEAEREHLPGSDLPAWQRVWRYWQAVPDFYERHMAWLQALPSTARQRTTLIDQPWSAAFISWLMRRSGLDAAQFAFSANHRDYVRAAIAATDAEITEPDTAYGWRACDLAQTAPRVGDLLCFARGADARLDTFAPLRQAVLNGPLPMHCELVVARSSAQIQTMGGNVLQTVVLRQLNLQPDGSGRLWSAYLEAAHRKQRRALAEQPPTGQEQPPWPQTYLNQQPWSLLLQMRSSAWHVDLR